MKLRIFTIITLIMLATAVIAGQPSHAVTQTPTNEQGLALEIAPPVLNFIVDPGETIKSEIAIRDVSNSSLLVTSEINDFTSSGEENGNPKVITDTDQKSPYSLILSLIHI